MSFQLFIILITILEIVTPVIVQGIKQILNNTKVKYNSTMVALFVSVIASLALGCFAYLHEEIPFTGINLFYLFFLIITNWLGATLGYDKLKQSLEKISEETGKL